MAASAGPRPGWSRRAQYSLFFSFLAVIAGLIVGLFLLILSLVAPQSYAAVRGAALDVTAPISGALSEVDDHRHRAGQRRRQLLGCGQPERQAQARARGADAADGRGARPSSRKTSS